MNLKTYTFQTTLRIPDSADLQQVLTVLNNALKTDRLTGLDFPLSSSGFELVEEAPEAVPDFAKLLQTELDYYLQRYQAELTQIRMRKLYQGVEMDLERIRELEARCRTINRRLWEYRGVDDVMRQLLRSPGPNPALGASWQVVR
jgi:ribosomal protein L29